MIPNGYSEAERGPWLGQKRICVDCQRETIETLVDGRCGQCIDPEGWERRMRAQNAEAVATAVEALPAYLRAKQREYQERASSCSIPSERRGYERAAKLLGEEADKAEAEKRGAA